MAGDSISAQKEAPELVAFERMIDGERMPCRWVVRALFEAMFSPVKAAIVFSPGVAGYTIRRFYYGHRLKHLGRNSLVDVGVIISGERNISIGDYVWIDTYCRLEAVGGFIEIGRRVHVAAYSILAGLGGLKIGDYVGISAHCRVYTTTATTNGKRMSGPMVPMRQKSVMVRPVTIERDAFLGTGAVVLPGVTIGEGAVIGANSVVTKDLPPWCIAVGAPARPVGRRPKVSVPDT